MTSHGYRIRACAFTAVLFVLGGADFRLAAQNTTPVIHGSGTTNFIPLWTSGSTIGNSSMSQSGGNITVAGGFSATSFTGNGAGLTNVNAATLGGFLPTAFARIGAANNFSGNQSITGNLSVSGTVSATSFLGNGSALSNVNAATLGGFSPSSFAQLSAGTNAFSGNLSVGGTLSAGTLSASTFSGNTINANSYQIGGFPVLTSSAATSSLYVGQNAGSNASNTGQFNVGMGPAALLNNTTGGVNTATGYNALAANTTGSDNTASGYLALGSNTTGNFNTAFGLQALLANSTGESNTATGFDALVANTTGGNNTATGYGALAKNTTGMANIAIGTGALDALTTGSNNVAIGGYAASNFTGNESGNIDINNGGVAGESGVIRIGAAQTATYIAGIYGASTSGVGFPVLVDSNGLLGTSGNGTFTGNLSVDGTLSAGTLSVSTFSSNTINSGTSYQIGGTPVLSTGTSATFRSLYVGQSAGSNASNTGQDNVGVGQAALINNTTGNFNTAIGSNALFSNDMGGGNTAVGALALSSNTTVTAEGNTATGFVALKMNTIGAQNTAVGAGSLQDNTTGNGNTAVGVDALVLNTTGSYNIAIGEGALYPGFPGPLPTGSNNIGIGVGAGSNLTGSESNNIDINNPGLAGDSGVIRIGANPGQSIGIQTATFIAGIYSPNTSIGPINTAVYVDSTGQLGPLPSSRRYKYDIQNMGDASSDLLKLRPVSFRYKQAQEDGSHPLQYGLVAEEVADVYPGLVAFDKAGEPQSVLYHVLPAMLLNEVQKQQRQIESQQQVIQSQQEQLKAQEERLRRLETLLNKKN